jgi:hypothetical protein
MTSPSALWNAEAGPVIRKTLNPASAPLLAFNNARRETAGWAMT